MKFLLIVLAIHLIGELIGTKIKDKKRNEASRQSDTVRHPAEYNLR